jgi:penicillin-binding protein 2
MKDFGMGEKTGIDLPFERSGIMPDSTWMNQTFGERKWGVGDLMSLGIGQGMVSVSPLQMAVAASVIANGGYVVKPHIVKEVIYPDQSRTSVAVERRRVEWLRESDLQVVREGMRRVVTEGGGRFYVNMQDVAVAGKTGTAQNPHGRDHGWFISFAPAEDPKIVVAVLLENSGFGSISAAPVASLMIEQYLKGTIERTRVLDYVMNFDVVEIEARRAEREREAEEARTQQEAGEAQGTQGTQGTQEARETQEVQGEIR